MAGTTRERWQMVFSGRVQRVGFRYTAYYLARGMGLTGWVDNLPDGRVAMEVQGEVPKLRQLLLQLKAKPHIRIEQTEIKKIPLRHLELKFTVKGYSE